MIRDNYEDLLASSVDCVDEVREKLLEEYKALTKRLSETNIKEVNKLIHYKPYDIYIDYNDYVNIAEDKLLYINNYTIMEYERYNTSDILDDENFSIVEKDSQEVLDISVGVDSKGSPVYIVIVGTRE